MRKTPLFPANDHLEDEFIKISVKIKQVHEDTANEIRKIFWSYGTALSGFCMAANLLVAQGALPHGAQHVTIFIGGITLAVRLYASSISNGNISKRMESHTTDLMEKIIPYCEKRGLVLRAHLLELNLPVDLENGCGEKIS